MTNAEKLRIALREFIRYEGDGLPDEPTGATLPIGDPASGEHNPSKAELRDALVTIGEATDDLDQAVTDAETAESGAETARTQAELAATAAGATIYDSTASGLSDTTDGDVFLVSTEPGVQVYRNDTGSATFLGWLGEGPHYDDVKAFFASSDTFTAGTYVRTRAEGFAYKATDATGDIANAGGQQFYDLSQAEKDTGDLVETLLTVSPKVEGLYVRSITNGIGVGVCFSGDIKAVFEHRFLFNGDNLLLHRGMYSGVQDDDALSVEPTLTGAYTTGSVNSYTTTVGDTFKATFTGSELYFQHYADNRGGVWEITLSNGWTRRISTWAASGTANNITEVFDNLPHGTYTVRGEFLGDDPINAPSGGTARGWINFGGSVGRQHAIQYSSIKPIDTSTEKRVGSNSSIVDFAIDARPSGAAYADEWVPQHGAVTGVSTDVIFRLEIDGITLSTAPGTSSAPTHRRIEKLKIAQSFEAKNPNGADGKMWDHSITHIISEASPYVSIRNRLIFAQDTRLSGAYFGMIAGDQANLSRLKTSGGYTADPIPADDSRVVRRKGEKSVAMIGEYSFSPSNKHAIGARVSSLSEAQGFGREFAPEAETGAGLIVFRSIGICKSYWRFAEPASVITTGTILTCQHDICGTAGIRHPNINV